jgi:hypothetical protein
MMNYGEGSWWKQAHLIGHPIKKKKIKGYAKSLETFNVFPILFPKFSFPYFYFYNHSRF